MSKIRRSCIPTVNRTDQAEPGQIGYSVAKSPWINCDQDDVPFYLGTYMIPANAYDNAGTPTALQYNRIISLTIEYSGKRNPDATPP